MCVVGVTSPFYGKDTEAQQREVTGLKLDRKKRAHLGWQLLRSSSLLPGGKARPVLPLPFISLEKSEPQGIMWNLLIYKCVVLKTNTNGLHKNICMLNFTEGKFI